jgi:hypothetical protein
MTATSTARELLTRHVRERIRAQEKIRNDLLLIMFMFLMVYRNPAKGKRGTRKRATKRLPTAYQDLNSLIYNDGRGG